MDAPIGPHLVPLGALALGAINLAAFSSFGVDKRRAEAGLRRIPERTLLSLAFWGGTPGAYAGRHVFRHKTRKQPFSDHLFAIVVLQVSAIGGGATWFLTG
ncbi:DUF1294 domain-containing protein [Altererythrobacter sp. TH136]|uniref:DUF1294 domain-containing protein n=1 Tax=Altererythrobacter sp. TH136 TaxID=2067415 RepID=UPI0011622F91|nr:DUF1294 domain-containing protein [Altererythrobacter sp. TH136]QDM40878.1 DUF1294 domain-containing protein [Altererythrobacter sp. TH136]